MPGDPTMVAMPARPSPSSSLQKLVSSRAPPPVRPAALRPAVSQPRCRAAHRLQTFTGSPFAFRLHRLRLAKLERVLRRDVRRVAYQDPVYGGSRLDAGSRVQHVTCGRPLALARPGAEHDQRLAGVDADPNVEVEPLILGVQLGDPPTDGKPRANAPFRVILVCLRRAEERQDGVATELLEGAAVPLELGPHTRRGTGRRAT